MQGHTINTHAAPRCPGCNRCECCGQWMHDIDLYWFRYSAPDPARPLCTTPEEAGQPFFDYRGRLYPATTREGRAAQFVFPFAARYCRGKGLDVGAGDCPLPGALAVDPRIDARYDADRLPPPPVGGYDYIFSSHCLEHVPDWVATLEGWVAALRPGGCLFLYLPHYDCEYWRPWRNRKHRHVLTPAIVADCLAALGVAPVRTGGPDLNLSFTVVGWKDPA